jgi:2-polyprenyl-6-methoxyphenol hydroxylase-like FAD-dependent oxidoreductase
MIQGPKIAVIGAGPAGLTFARLLQQNNLSCTIYEADSDRHARDQGGSLDLHRDGGQAALKEAGLFEQFRHHARPESQALKLVSYDGKILWDENVMGNVRPQELDDRPEIDRTKLRDILLDSVNPDAIKWSHKVAIVETDSKGKHTITFADGSRVDNIDLLVGADGAWSNVRPLLTDIQPHYSGITGVELCSLNASKTNPWLDQYVGAGSCFMFDEGRAVMCQRSGNDSIRLYAFLRKPVAWKDEGGIDWTNGDDVRQALVDDYFRDCSEDTKRVILSAKDGCQLRQLYMLPVGHTWSSHPSITLLGDSAHLMTPFAGVGVNVAMTDALSLARQIVQRKDSLRAKVLTESSNIQKVIRDYEREMFPRAEQNAKKTYKGLVGHFSKEGGSEMAMKFHKAFQELQKKQGSTAEGRK